MPTLPSLRPNGQGTNTNWETGGGGTTNLHLEVDDDPDSHDGDTTVIRQVNVADATVFFDLTATPTDFQSMVSVQARVVVKGIGVAVGGTLTLHAQVFESNETTPLTSEVQVTSFALTGLTYTLETAALTGVVPGTKTKWDGARLRIRADYTSGGVENPRFQITAIEVDGVYNNLPILLVNGDGTGPRNWNPQDWTTIDEGIAAVNHLDNVSGVTNQTADTSFKLANMPADFESMGTLLWQFAWRRWSADDTITLGTRIVSRTSGAILAAASSGGAFAQVSTGTGNTSNLISSVTAFAFVNTTATKAAWDDAEVEFRQTYSQNMSADGDARVQVNTLEFTGTYTTGGTNATATPAVIATTTSLPAATVQASSQVTATAVATTTTLPQASAGTAATVIPATIPATAALPAATTSAGSSAQPATVSVPAVIPTPTLAAGALTAPATIATVTSLGAATVTGSALTQPSTLAVVAALPAAVTAASATTTPASITLAFTLPPATAVAGDATATPPLIALATALPGLVTAAGSSVTPTVLAANTVLPTASVGVGQAISPATLAVSAAFPATGFAAGAAVTPAAIAVTVLILSPSATGLPSLSQTVRMGV